MSKRATPIWLREEERAALLQVTKRRKSGQQLVLRAQIVLAAAQGSSNIQIAHDLGINVDTVRLWRDRWASWQENDYEQNGEAPVPLIQRLQDASRPGAVPKFTAEQRAQMAILACEAPAKTGCPISQWTGREIADELVARGIVLQISPRHAARLLKKGASTPIDFGIGSVRKPIPTGKRKSWRGARFTPKRLSEPSRENARSAWMK